MKTKKTLKAIVSVLLGAAMSFSAFAAIGCGEPINDEGKNPPVGPVVVDPTKAEIKITVDKEVINAGTNETIKATAEVTVLEDKGVIWSLDGNGAEYATISQDGVLSLVEGKTPRTDKLVTIVATASAYAQTKQSVTVTIKAQRVEGQVGELTNAMLAQLGNSQITVSGKVIDVFDDLQNNQNDRTQEYDYTVKMSDGAWYGEWNRKNSSDKEISNYRRSQNTIAGSNNHTFDLVYINKDNQVAQKMVKDYNSDPLIWENRHMWNHLEQLGLDVENQWTYDTEHDVYTYKTDNKSEEDLYLRTYLAYSLTPMLGNSDTLDTIELTIENGRITKLRALTEILYYGAKEEGSSKDATSLSYTELIANFTGVGATVVPDPAPYEAPEHADKLTAAMNAMKASKNYTFFAKDTTVSAPSINEDDYGEYAASGYVSNNTGATGTVGVYGEITADAILLASTSKYQATLDGKPYLTEYTGYKQVGDDVYDYFAYDYEQKALVGQRQYKGNIFDNMPKFDFSVNIFEFDSSTTKKIDGVIRTVYNFTLREPAVTRDVAMQISAHRYATSAVGATHGTLKISIVENGDNVFLNSTSFPYDLVSGTYLGVIDTTYSKIGSTAIEEGTFDTYIPRVVKTDWAQYDVKYYHANHSTLGAYDDITADALFTLMFDDKKSLLPPPTVFTSVFGDSVSGPFFDWETIDNTATGGSKVHYDLVDLTVGIDGADENGKITKEQHDETISKLATELAKYNFAVSRAQSGIDSSKDYYTTFISENGQGNIMVRVENNRTRWFFITICTVETWSKTKGN